MKITLTNTIVSKLESKKNRYDVWDAKLTGLYVRVFSTGKKTYRCFCRHDGIKSNVTIGKVELFTVSEAREKAKVILGNAAQGIVPEPRANKKNKLTLCEFIEKEYAPWRLTNRKDGKSEIEKLRTKFLETFGNLEFKKINLLQVERWRSKRLNTVSASTVNRDVAALKVVFSRALDWGFIEENPLAKLKQIKTVDEGIVRYLENDEETRLRKSLDDREEKLKHARDSGNQWRKERGYELMPEFNGDYLKPMVLLSINTGLRKSELLGLVWEHINFYTKLLSIPGSESKSKKTKHIPLNKEAYNVLKSWKEISNNARGLVFQNHDGKKFTDIKKVWESLRKAADIKNFRWHDMRHHFASRLVMAGVDLNTVRELLGHADIKMTLRYAHLAPEHKARAVEKLIE